MILIVGATGNLGSDICRQLAEGDKPVRALVRSTSNPEAVERLKGCGAAIVEGDLKDPTSLERACSGARVVISTATAIVSRQEGDSFETVDQEGQKALIDAAANAGVERFIYISFPEKEEEHPLQDAKRAAEDHLRKSGLTYTILQPVNFMEMWLGPALGFDYPNAKARVYGSGDSKVSWISLHDVAKVAVASLEHEAARNATFRLGGPEALSYHEVIAIFEEEGGRAFEVEHVPEEALQAQLEAAPDPLSKTFAGLMLGTAKGWEITPEDGLPLDPGRFTSVREYARRVSATA